jgi:hypothetical protein
VPRRLLQRCSDDSIREDRAAAQRRFDDRIALAANGRRTGAIYVWGYALEMTVKAAYFSLIGLPDTHVIRWDVHRRGDKVTVAQCRQAMIEECASTVLEPDMPQLHFAAKKMPRRLIERLPEGEPISLIGRDVGSVESWAER